MKGKTSYRKTPSTSYAVVFYYHLGLKVHLHHEDDNFLLLPKIQNRKYAWRVVWQFFEYVADRANQKYHHTGQNRTFYSLRHYGIEVCIRKSGGTVDLFGLTGSAGTSVAVIQKFYVRRLGLPNEMVENLQSFS